MEKSQKEMRKRDEAISVIRIATRANVFIDVKQTAKYTDLTEIEVSNIVALDDRAPKLSTE